MGAGQHVPVVIIGSGPIGLTLANLLGVYGISTAVVERNLTTVQEPRAVSIDDESLRTLQSAGVVAEVLNHVVTGYGSIYYGPTRKPFTHVEPTGRPYGYPRRNAFQQPVLEQQLREALGRFPHVSTFYGWELVHYEQGSEGVTLALAHAEAGPRRITCDYLIGCDGAASRVREGLGLQLEGTTFEERWLILDLENNRNTIKHTEVYCDPRRPCITLPGPNDTRRYEFKLMPGETDADLLEADMVAKLLASHGADPGARLRRKVVYRFHARAAPAWSRGRVFLAGDAAHLTPPFAGQGMNSGLRDAQNLSWKLAAVVNGQLGHGLLATYEQERKDHLWQMIRLALRMGRVMAPRTALHGVVSRLFFRSLNIWPAARDYVVQMKYKPAPYFSRGFLVPGPSPLVGRLLPQPEVRMSTGDSCLLDEVLGPGFALILRTRDPASAWARLAHPLWNRLQPQRVVLHPYGTGSTADLGSGPLNLTEVSSTSDVFASSSETAILLRPDRYVAAVIPIAAPESALRQIESLIGGTWPKDGSGHPASAQSETGVRVRTESHAT